MTRRGVLLVLSLLSFPVLADEMDVAAATDMAADAASPADAAPAPATTDAAAATAEAAAPAAGNPDPWQGFNRVVFRFNDKLDRYALKPVAKGYKKVTPRPVRTGITNFFNNLRSPIVVLNDLLQGKVRNAGSDTARFLVNTTVGLAGFLDVSTRAGLPMHDEDFGQTLGVWGVPSGPYLVLPFLGPSSVRDGIGYGVDVYAHPRTHYLTLKQNVGITAADAVNTRANLLEVESIVQGDRYLFMRDLYLQHREFLIKDGKVESDPFLDDSMDEDDGGADAAPGPEEPAPEASPPAAGETGGEPVPPAPAGEQVPSPSAPAVPATPGS